MKCLSILAAMLALAATLAEPAAAGALEDAEAADARGDYVLEESILRPLAERGDTRAQAQLGVMYNGEGNGRPMDCAQSLMWLRKAASGGDKDARFILDMEADASSDGPDCTLTIGWYRDRAAGGDAHAQERLGELYFHGKSVPQNYAQALVWYRRAADQGDAAAQYYLGDMYAKGVGVTLDFTQAHVWFNLSASHSCPFAEYCAAARDALAAKMTPAQIAEAQKRAQEWVPRK
jgi:uncharacterized protein